MSFLRGVVVPPKGESVVFLRAWAHWLDLTMARAMSLQGDKPIMMLFESKSLP